MKPLYVLSIIVILMPTSAFTQEEGRGISSPLSAVIDQQAALQDTTPPSADFIPVDQVPIVIEKREPVYPEAALKAGLEGKVWVKIWVDKEGRARNVQILKSDAEVFNKSVIDAALGFRFKPASIKDKPIDVWVSVPFEFKLAHKPDGPVGRRYDDVSQFVRDILECKPVDSTRACRLVYPEAYAVLGGEYVPLIEAIRRQAGGRNIIEKPKRKIAFANYRLNEKGDASFMTLKTEGSGNHMKPRYHTIVLFSDEKGEWTIREWHRSE